MLAFALQEVAFLSMEVLQYVRFSKTLLAKIPWMFSVSRIE